VTFRDALEVMGLEDVEAMTPDQLRRAYLRRLRLHPPERDPDGFARLRAGFELLQRAVASRAALAAAGLRLVETDDGLGVVPEDEAAWSAAVEEVEAAADEAAPDPPPEPAADDDIRAEGDDGAADEDVRAEAEPDAADGEPAVDGVPPLDEMTMAELVDLLVELLQERAVDEAVDLERAWREEHDGDDCLRVDQHDSMRWLLARELVGVAGELPPPVLGALADGLAAGDLGTARARLEGFKSRASWASASASALLERRAPTIFPFVRGTLAAPPRADRPVRRRAGGGGGGGGGARPVWLLGLFAVMIVRVVMQLGSTSTTPTYQHVDPPDLTDLGPPPPPDDDATSYARAASEARVVTVPAPDGSGVIGELAPLLGDVTDGAHRLAGPHSSASRVQRAAAVDLEAAARHQDCSQMARAWRRLLRAPADADRKRAGKTTTTVAAIGGSLARLCPDEGIVQP